MLCLYVEHDELLVFPLQVPSIKAILPANFTC